MRWRNRTSRSSSALFGTDGNLGEQLGLTKDWVVAHREGGRQLRRVLRSQRRRRLQARDRPRPQPALEQGRNPVRAADPLIASPRAAAMTIEPRKPPPQFVAKLQRALGGRAGWSGFVVQILFVAVLAWIGYEIVANARANLQTQRITAGFGFLKNTAGFDVSQNLIPYTGIRYLHPRLPGRPAQHAAGLGDRHFLRHRDRIHRRARPAVAELAVVAHLRRLCRRGAQSAAAVPDPVLVSRGARGAAESAAEHLAVRQLLSHQSRPGHSKADRQSRLRAVRRLPS